MENKSFAIEEIDACTIGHQHNSVNNNISKPKLMIEPTKVNTPPAILISRPVLYSADYYPNVLNKPKNGCKQPVPTNIRVIEHDNSPYKCTTDPIHYPLEDRLLYRKSLVHDKSKFSLTPFVRRTVSQVKHVIPILSWLPNYSFRQLLVTDLIAGLVLSASHISDGIAFGWMTGLAPVHGLYMAIFPVLVYAVLGKSRQVSIGKAYWLLLY